MEKEDNLADLPPTKLLNTALERSIFGFSVEMDRLPEEYFTQNYLQNLLHQENLVSNCFNKMMKSFLLLNAVALLYMQGLKKDFVIFGNEIPEFPASINILCFVLGLNIFGLAVQGLNLIILSRIKNMWVRKVTGTDVPNLSIAHLDGKNVWSDLLTPRCIGYKSGPFHILLGFIFMFTVLAFFFSVFVAGGVGLWALFDFGLQQSGFYLDWPNLVSFSGLVIGYTGIAMIFVVLIMPLNFIIDDVGKSKF